jgi:ribosomal protein L15E
VHHTLASPPKDTPALRPETHQSPTNTLPPQDARINWICNPVHKHRELRGLTSAGKKYRGLRGKGSRYVKNGPSKRATWLKHNSPSLRRYR